MTDLRLRIAAPGSGNGPLSPASCSQPEFILVDSDRSSTGDSGPKSSNPNKKQVVNDVCVEDDRVGLRLGMVGWVG